MKSMDRKRSMKRENVHVSQSSPMMLRKSLTSSLNSKTKKAGNSTELLSPKIPRNSAVHFCHFYNRKNASDDIFSRRRAEFTRQMVNKLESLSGTPEYANQVAAILSETLEPPNFSVQVPPRDNYPSTDIPVTYPLWYKEPNMTTHQGPIKDVGLQGSS